MATRAITVAARSSLLSRAQVQEVQALLQRLDPTAKLIPVWVEAYGDRDQTTSLRDLPPSDFFTREIDALVQEHRARLAIHSAKDLPPETPAGLVVAGLTPCLDPRDALVLREGLQDLPDGATVATSSPRRDEQVRSLFPQTRIADLRGTIHARLARLQHDCHGVVVAECALMRLGLTHLNRIFLDGPTADRQGQLALVCRMEDSELIKLIQRACAQPSPMEPAALAQMDFGS